MAPEHPRRLRPRSRCAIVALWHLGLGLACLGPDELRAAQEEAAPAKLVIDLRAAQQSAAWIAAAWEQNFYHDLSGFTRLEPVDKHDVDTSSCGNPRDDGCALALYAEAGIEVVVLGRLDDRALRYEVHETWTHSRIARATLSLGPRVTLEKARRDVLRSLKPILESGGLLDRRSFLVSQDSDVEHAPASQARPQDALWLRGLLLLLLLLQVIARLLARRQRPFKATPGAASGLAHWTLSTLALSLGLAGLSHPTVWEPATFRIASLDLMPYVVALRPVVGGTAWGVLALLLLRATLPPLHGMERIRHSNLTRMLHAWVSIAGSRVFVLVLAYVPLVWALWRFAVSGPFHPQTVLWLVAPLVGIMAHYWFVVLADTVALSVDHAYVVGTAGFDNPWHAAVQTYFNGYVRRAGLVIDAATRSRLLFLPGTNEGTVAYGGGLGAIRIAINADLLEMALGPLQEDHEAPPEAPGVEDWAGGIVTPVPVRAKKVAARMRRLGARANKLMRRRQVEAQQPRPFSVRRVVSPRLVGRNETLLGYVLPVPAEESIPLISNSDDDLSVVSALLTDHYAAFDPGTYGQEYDDTDPTQKDLLFGALLREVGEAHRRATVGRTFGLAVGRWVEQRSVLVRKLASRIGDLHARWSSRFSAILADGYVALNHGRDHLIQYLYWLHSAETDRLTARGDPPKLLAVSASIVAAVAAAEPSREDRQAFRATVRNRLLWMSHFLSRPVAVESDRRVRVLLWGTTLMVLLGWLGHGVLAAVEYEPIYRERMQKLQQQMLERAKQGKQNHGAP